MNIFIKNVNYIFIRRNKDVTCTKQKEDKEMKLFKFWISFSNKKDYEIQEHGENFAECLQKAQNRAKFVGGKVCAWDEISL
jgi:hypothetical protein